MGVATQAVDKLASQATSRALFVVTKFNPIWNRSVPLPPPLPSSGGGTGVNQRRMHRRRGAAMSREHGRIARCSRPWGGGSWNGVNHFGRGDAAGNPQTWSPTVLFQPSVRFFYLI